MLQGYHPQPNSPHPSQHVTPEHGLMPHYPPIPCDNDIPGQGKMMTYTPTPTYRSVEWVSSSQIFIGNEKLGTLIFGSESGNIKKKNKIGKKKWTDPFRCLACVKER